MARNEVGPATAQEADDPGRAAAGRVRDLDVLFGVAVAVVLAAHLSVATRGLPVTEPAGGYLALWPGVELLLAATGFVAARALAGRLARAHDLGGRLRGVGAFWLGCAWRVGPSAVLWLAVVLVCTLGFNRSGAFGAEAAARAGVLASLLEVENLRLLRGAPQDAAYPWWALSLAAQFCLGLPLGLALCRSRLWPLAGVALVVLLFRPSMPWRPGGFVRPDALALGALVAVWARTPTWRLFEPTGLRSTRLGRALAPALLLGLLGCVGSDRLYLAPFTLGVVAVLAAALVWLASYERGYLLPEGLAKRAFAWGGRRALGLYLAHVPAFLAAREIWSRLHPASLTDQPPHLLRFAATGLALVALLAEFNYRLIEAPLGRLGVVVGRSLGVGPARSGSARDLPGPRAEGRCGDVEAKARAKA